MFSEIDPVDRSLERAISLGTRSRGAARVEAGVPPERATANQLTDREECRLDEAEIRSIAPVGMPADPRAAGHPS